MVTTAAATVVYTDGACSGNPGPGGWAWAVPGGPFRSGAEARTTNQRMELAAALEALRSLDGPVVVMSDSTYVVNCFRDRWYDGLDPAGLAEHGPQAGGQPRPVGTADRAGAGPWGRAGGRQGRHRLPLGQGPQRRSDERRRRPAGGRGRADPGGPRRRPHARPGRPGAVRPSGRPRRPAARRPADAGRRSPAARARRLRAGQPGGGRRAPAAGRDPGGQGRAARRSRRRHRPSARRRAAGRGGRGRGRRFRMSPCCRTRSPTASGPTPPAGGSRSCSGGRRRRSSSSGRSRPTASGPEGRWPGATAGWRHQVDEAVVVWNGKDPNVGKLVRKLQGRLGEENVWIVDVPACAHSRRTRHRYAVLSASRIERGNRVRPHGTERNLGHRHRRGIGAGRGDRLGP